MSKDRSLDINLSRVIFGDRFFGDQSLEIDVQRAIFTFDVCGAPGQDPSKGKAFSNGVL